MNITKYKKLNMTEHKTDMNITKIDKYKKLKYKVSKNWHTTHEDKSNQIHSQINIHNEHLNNITKFGKYKKTEHDRTQNRHEHY